MSVVQSSLISLVGYLSLKGNIGNADRSFFNFIVFHCGKKQSEHAA